MCSTRAAAMAVQRRAFATQQISAAMVKELRRITNAPMMECKTALSSPGVDGDMEKAVDWLRKNGVATAEKKSGRETAAGVVGALVQQLGGSNGKGVAALVEVNSETDFVAKNEHFLAAVDAILAATIAADPAALIAKAAAANANAGTGANNNSKLHNVDVPALLEARVEGADGSVRGLVTRVVATVRENIAVRRAARLAFDPATEVVGIYVHNSAGSNSGSSAAAVMVRCFACVCARVKYCVCCAHAYVRACECAAGACACARRNSVPSNAIQSPMQSSHN